MYWISELLYYIKLIDIIIITKINTQSVMTKIIDGAWTNYSISIIINLNL